MIQLEITHMSSVKEVHCVQVYSYPNLIPLPSATVQRIRDTITPWQFERLYGAWFDRVVEHNAHEAVLCSAERYVRALETVRSEVS